MKGKLQKPKNKRLHLPQRKQGRDKGEPKKMNKQATTTIMTRLRWGAFFLVLLFLVIQVVPGALGQRDASKRSSDVEIPSLKQQPAPLEPGSKSLCHLNSGTWTPTGSLNTARLLHTATLLPNDMMLVTAGGFSNNTHVHNAPNDPSTA